MLNDWFFYSASLVFMITERAYADKSHSYTMMTSLHGSVEFFYQSFYDFYQSCTEPQEQFGFQCLGGWY